jgi:MYXO-CTERM domain-containing protein
MTGPGAADMATPGSNSGCGCRVGGGQRPRAEPLAALFALLIVLVVRRGKRTRRQRCTSRR